MRKIKADLIKSAVAALAREANFILRPDVKAALKSALAKEADRQARSILRAIIDNSRIAEKENLAICQDTGLAVVFVELGQGAQITGGPLYDSINEGIYAGYKQGYLRNSIIKNPILRGKPGFSPAVIHADIIPGDKVRLMVLPKGFGCENKGQVKMFNPTAAIADIKAFIIDTVRKAGPDACPPFIVGVGIGGTQDYACLLAKKALLKRVTGYGLRDRGYVSKLEHKLLREINRLGIGPMGLGGKTTCLGVNIETYPTHIAGLPVAVNISCHALRSATRII